MEKILMEIDLRECFLSELKLGQGSRSFKQCLDYWCIPFQCSNLHAVRNLWRSCMEPTKLKIPLSKVSVKNQKVVKETKVIKVAKFEKSVIDLVQGESYTWNGTKKKGLILNASFELKIENMEK
jgi:hypothetical protein